MLKGQEETDMAIGVLIFTFILIIILGFMGSDFIKVNTEVKTARESLNVIDIWHMTKVCFSEDGIIKESLLTNERLESCKIPDSYIVVTDLEDNNKGPWVFGSVRDGYEHELYVSILTSEDRIDMGELSVKI